MAWIQMGSGVAEELESHVDFGPRDTVLQDVGTSPIAAIKRHERGRGCFLKCDGIRFAPAEFRKSEDWISLKPYS